MAKKLTERLRIAILFGVKRSAITKYLNNIFQERELDKTSLYSIWEHTAEDGENYFQDQSNLIQTLKPHLTPAAHPSPDPRASQFSLTDHEIEVLKRIAKGIPTQI